jgi:LruC domain-containing protein
MSKKILIGLLTVAVVAGGVAALSAFEAHVINVTAHVENALNVSPKEIAFGTVFPQEYVDDNFTISLSDSFLTTGRLDDVEYVINQKPKCKSNTITDKSSPLLYKPLDYATHECPAGYTAMASLCSFLSKLPQDADGEIGEPSYYDPQTDSCPARLAVLASGRLAKSLNDLSDTWKVDLKVPPIAGNVAQDWPVGCPTVPAEDDYGCDLWVEVTNLSTVKEYPVEGSAYIGYEDWHQGDFDYNDFGMNFNAKEFYKQIGGTDYLSRLYMKFEAVIYDSGAEHYIHGLRKPLSGSYTYTVTRSGSAYAGEIATGTYTGSGDLNLVLFNTIKYAWPQIGIGEYVEVEVTLDNPLANPKTALPAPRPDLDPFMANYDPDEVVYQGQSGTFHIDATEIVTDTTQQKNTPRIIPIGIELPYILVVPITNWKAPHEDTTITSPYWHFLDYYDGLKGDWGPGGTTWYNDIDPLKNFVGYGGLAF